MAHENNLLTSAEVASMLRVSEGAIDKAVSRGEFPAPVKIIGKNRWPLAAVRQHIDTTINQAQAMSVLDQVTASIDAENQEDTAARRDAMREMVAIAVRDILGLCHDTDASTLRQIMGDYEVSAEQYKTLLEQVPRLAGQLALMTEAESLLGQLPAVRTELKELEKRHAAEMAEVLKRFRQCQAAGNTITNGQLAIKRTAQTTPDLFEPFTDPYEAKPLSIISNALNELVKQERQRAAAIQAKQAKDAADAKAARKQAEKEAEAKPTEQPQASNNPIKQRRNNRLPSVQ